MNELILVPPSNLPHIIDIVLPKIESAASYSVGKYKGSDIIKFLASGNMQLWLSYDEENDKLEGLAITEIAVYPQRKICRFLCVTGDKQEHWFDYLKDIEAWGITMGCDGFQAECRPGWEKFLKPNGYKKSHIIMGKELGSCH